MSFIRRARLTTMRPWSALEVGIVSILRMPGLIVWKSRRESPYVKHGYRQGEPSCTAWGQAWRSSRAISHQGDFLTLLGFQEMVGSFPSHDLVYHSLYGKVLDTDRPIHSSYSYREAELVLLTHTLRSVSSNLHSKGLSAARGCGLIWEWQLQGPRPNRKVIGAQK